MFEINEAIVLAAAVLVSAVLATELFGYVPRMAVLPWYFLNILTWFTHQKSGFQTSLGASNELCPPVGVINSENSSHNSKGINSSRFTVSSWTKVRCFLVFYHFFPSNWTKLKKSLDSINCHCRNDLVINASKLTLVYFGELSSSLPEIGGISAFSKRKQMDL